MSNSKNPSARSTAVMQVRPDSLCKTGKSPNYDGVSCWSRWPDPETKHKLCKCALWYRENLPGADLNHVKYLEVWNLAKQLEPYWRARLKEEL